jgi:hypothetical protein
MMKKLGVVNSWNATKYVGTIICRDTKPVERYFLFASRVVSGPEPTTNSYVRFDVDQRPPLPGKLSAAIHVEVLDDTEKAELIAGMLDSLNGSSKS